MKIKVESKCDRCQRKNEREIDSGDLAAFEAQEARIEEKADHARDYLEKLSVADMPDLIVCFKGEIWIQNHICDEYCTKTIKNELENGIFRTINVSKRGARKSNGGEEGHKTNKRSKKDKLDKQEEKSGIRISAGILDSPVVSEIPSAVSGEFPSVVS